MHTRRVRGRSVQQRRRTGGRRVRRGVLRGVGRGGRGVGRWRGVRARRGAGRRGGRHGAEKRSGGRGLVSQGIGPAAGGQLGSSRYNLAKRDVAPRPAVLTAMLAFANIRIYYSLLFSE